MQNIKITSLQKQQQLSSKPLIACWGFFDGVHRGHQQLLQQVVMIAKDNDYATCVISFDVKPQMVVNDSNNHILLPPNIKNQIISNYHIAYFLEIIFTKKLALASPEQFIAWMWSLNIRAVVVSPNIRFGYQNKGTLATLQASPLKVYLCPEINDNGHKISSSYIKQLLQQKDINAVNQLLAPQIYTIAGTVIPGRQEGRMLGFPTANLLLNANYALPPLATYITLTAVNNKWYQSMTVIMMRNEKPLVETYLLNFAGDLYGQVISVRFLAFLRDNLQFTSLDALKKQLDIDLANTLTYFDKHK